MTTLHSALQQQQPLQIAGVIHAYAAKLAEQAGFHALYLSGAGVANAQFALPDLAMTSMNDVVDMVSKITAATSLPLLVDVDTGWGSPLNVYRTFKCISQAGAAGAHIEDQTEAKRCGHRDGKQIVTQQEMIGRIKAALDGRDTSDFMVMARTDAIAVEGIDKALERAIAYQNAGAEAIFVEAITELSQYTRFSQALNIPILANITEFGKTPLFTLEALKQAGVSMALYPLSAFRAMNAAALQVYSTIRTQGTQQSLIPLMQTRAELYDLLHYEAYEKKLDDYLSDGAHHANH